MKSYEVVSGIESILLLLLLLVVLIAAGGGAVWLWKVAIHA